MAKDRVKYYVVRSKSGSRKFADGWYGWDAYVHSDEQIFPGNEMPYRPNDDMDFIQVGEGEKPSLQTVQEQLHN